jgi:hypothetical protein
MGLKKTYSVERDTGKLIAKQQFKPKAVHAVRDDTLLEPIESMITGEKFDSMTRYKRHLDQHGYEITGGDHLQGRAVDEDRTRFKTEHDRREHERAVAWGMALPDPDIYHTVREAERKIKWGMAPLSDKEKEICQRESRKIQDYKNRRKWI